MKIEKIVIKYCNKARAEIYKTYEQIKENENPKFRNYTLQDYFSDLDAELMEIADKILMEIGKNDD